MCLNQQYKRPKSTKKDDDDFEKIPTYNCINYFSVLLPVIANIYDEQVSTIEYPRRQYALIIILKCIIATPYYSLMWLSFFIDEFYDVCPLYLLVYTLTHSFYSLLKLSLPYLFLICSLNLSTITEMKRFMIKKVVTKM